MKLHLILLHILIERIIKIIIKMKYINMIIGLKQLETGSFLKIKLNVIKNIIILKKKENAFLKLKKKFILFLIQM